MSVGRPGINFSQGASILIRRYYAHLHWIEELFVSHLVSMTSKSWRQNDLELTLILMEGVFMIYVNVRRDVL